MVALVQDVPRPRVDKNAFQELDHVALFQGVCKWLRRVNDAARIDDYIDMAFTAAATGRPGPAVLLLPWDLMDEPEAGKTQRKADAADKSMVFSDPAKDPTIPAVGNSSSWGCQVVLADPRTELRAPQGR